jgi:hypothetical protein
MPLRSVALICGCLCAATSAASEPVLLGEFLWERDEDYFGGLSGIELSADGSAFFVIGDSSIVLTGNIQRDGTRITGVRPDPSWIGGLRMPDGTRVDKDHADAEGLAISQDGEIFVSFERKHRVWAYAGQDGPARALPALPDTLAFRKNGGLEALAVAPDGALWALPEHPPWGWDALPVLRLAEGRWAIAGQLPLDRVFRPVGADFADDGSLYVLERGVGLRGFSSRVRQFGIAPGGLTGGEVVLRTTPGQHGNLEGLAVWRALSGALVLTMVADDNYNRFQVTEIVEYGLTE